MKGRLTDPSRKIIACTIFWVAAFGLPACSLPSAKPTVTSPPSITPNPTNTFTSRPPPTNTLTHTAIPSSTPTATPFAPFSAAVLANNVNLRTNPGYLFDIRASLLQDSQVMVLGRSPGGEWIYVRLSTGTEGWIFAQLLNSSVDLNDAPLIEPGPVQLVAGRVLDEAGQPVSGIHFALVKGPGDTPPRTDATTGKDGMFYAFLPLGADGDWNIYYTAIACTSNVMDADCNCLGGDCGQPVPSDLIITLPVGEPINFIWK